MWERTYSQFYANVSVDAIWCHWIDVNNWSKWHSDLDYCKLKGKFAVGNYFMLKPTGSPAVKIKIIEVNDKHSFTDCTTFLGAKMFDTNTVEVKDNGVLLSSKLVVTGPLKWLWIKLVANNVAKTVPTEMEALVKLASQEALIS